ncbi:MAG: thiamine-monophosphate kinase [Spartobacteria bacterium]|nr:thiamine-monophosphate kinase [Spartobacteria bacterium]
MSTLREMGEQQAIAALAQRLSVGADDVVVGIGDDAAVVRGGEAYDLTLTSDPLIRDTHFTLDIAPERIGHKAAGRVLSDLAAMGSEPSWLLVNVVAPANTEITFLERMYDGMNALCVRYDTAVIGGDLAQGNTLELHVFGVGRVPRGQALLRSGARIGDAVYVTGNLGGSLLGHHLDFEPRLREAQWLREGGWAHALTDISDGLATDMRHIAEMSRVGITLRLAEIPVAEAATRMPDNRPAIEHALCDGEDFELLFTVASEKATAFETAWRDTFELSCTRVGEVTPVASGMACIDQDGRRTALACAGYEHFKGDRYE